MRVHVKTTEESARATAVLSQVLLPSMYMLPLSEFSCLVERWALDGRGVECGRDLEDGEEASPIWLAFALTRAVIMSQNLLQRSLCMLCRTGRWHVWNACCVRT